LFVHPRRNKKAGGRSGGKKKEGARRRRRRRMDGILCTHVPSYLKCWEVIKARKRREEKTRGGSE
jgi:hypothetical protein